MLMVAAIKMAFLVVLHELCHIKEFNHKGEFFELMENIIPNWKKWDSKLRLAFPEIVIK